VNVLHEFEDFVLVSHRRNGGNEFEALSMFRKREFKKSERIEERSSIAMQ
jgi:hypothetical protein